MEDVSDGVTRGHHSPGSPLQLVHELPRRPPRVAGVDAQCLQMRDEIIRRRIQIDDSERSTHPAESLRLHVHRVIGWHRCRGQTQSAVQGHGSTLEELGFSGEMGTPERQHGADIQVRGLVEHDSERPGLVMLQEQDHRAVEGLFQCGRRDEKSSGQGFAGFPTDHRRVQHAAIVSPSRKSRDTLGGMSTITLTEETFAATVQDSPIVLIDFWAAWCGPCRMFAPVFEKASEAHTDIVFAKVDTEAQPGLAQVFQISSIPTLMAIRDGVVIYSQAGALPEQGLEQLIQAVRDADMDEVRASIADEKAAASSE